jgi:hypothetical protein
MEDASAEAMEAVNCIKPYDFCEGWAGYEKSLNAITILKGSQSKYTADWLSAEYSHKEGGVHALVDQFVVNDEQLASMFLGKEREVGSDCFTFVDTTRRLAEFAHLNHDDYDTAMELKYGVVWCGYPSYKKIDDIPVGTFMTEIVMMMGDIGQESFSSWKVQRGLSQHKGIAGSMVYIRSTVRVLVPEELTILEKNDRPIRQNTLCTGIQIIQGFAMFLFCYGYCRQQMILNVRAHGRENEESKKWIWFVDELAQKFPVYCKSVLRPLLFLYDGLPGSDEPRAHVPQFSVHLNGAKFILSTREALTITVGPHEGRHRYEVKVSHDAMP